MTQVLGNACGLMEKSDLKRCFYLNDIIMISVCYHMRHRGGDDGIKIQV